MIRLLDEIRQRLPHDSRERVIRTRESFNRSIRDSLEELTTLKLRIVDGSSIQHASIEIKVEEGFPASLEAIGVSSADEIADLISSYRSDVERLRQSAGSVADLITRLVRMDETLPECDDRFRDGLGTVIEL